MAFFMDETFGTEMPSPDCSGNPFMECNEIKDCSGKQVPGSLKLLTLTFPGGFLRCEFVNLRDVCTGRL